MKDFIISTENTCDLSINTLNNLSVSAINMEYTVGDQVYGGDTGKELSYQDFYNQMKAGAKTHTSMINDQRAREYLSNLLATGKDVLHISFASACSGTYDAFCRASKELNSISKNKVYVIDSRCECTAQGLLVKLCVEKKQKGASLIEVKQYGEDILHRINSLFTVDNLKYLVAGGRVSKSSALIGNVLNVKPVLYVDKLGNLTPGSKVISRRLSLNKIIKMTADKFSKECPYIYVSHADCEGDANFVAKKILDLTGAQVFIENIGPIIGAHSGPGTIAVFFVGKDRSF